MEFEFKNQYLQSVYEKTAKRNPGEKEFLQAVGEVLLSLEPVVEKDPSYETNGVIDRIVEPERMIQSPALSLSFFFHSSRRMGMLAEEVLPYS